MRRGGAPAGDVVVRELPRCAPAGLFIYLTEVDLSVDDGPGINEREFVAALRKHHRDEVICIVPYPAQPEVHHDNGLEYVVPHRGSPLRYAGHLAAAYRRIAELHRHYPISGLVCRLGATPIVPYAVHRILGVPVLLKTLALYSLFAEDAAFRRSRSRLASRAGLAGRVLAPVYRSLLRSALVADTVSEPYAAWLIHRFGIAADRIRVIPNAVNPLVFSPGNATARRRALGLDRFDQIIGYVGRLTEIRHLDLLIRSTAALRAEANVGLVLVGSGKDRDRLASLARETGAADAVVFVGAVPYAQVPDYVRCFDVAVDLTLVEMRVDSRVLRSSFSQKIPQYLACGVPVVAWDVGDTRFLVHRGIGAVAPFPDGDGVTAALRALVRLDAGERRRTRFRARAYAESCVSTERLAAERVRIWRAAVTGVGAG